MRRKSGNRADTRVADAEDSGFSPDFVDRYSALTDWKTFREILLTPLRRSIRVNTLKTTVPEVLKALSEELRMEPVPWCKEGFWVSPGEGLGSHPLHERGDFYVQEAASMIPAVVLDARPGEKVLDMCASPGSKATQIAQGMGNRGDLVLMDIREDRTAILKRNISRMGVTNCKIIQKPGQQVAEKSFDRILVDAPCSGTGNMCGDPEEVRAWNPEIFTRIPGTQKSLLHHAYCALRKGGLLVYSTCSLEPEENEAVVDWLLKRHKKTELEDIILPLNRSAPMTELGGKKLDPRIEKCLRLWPQDNNTAGFFVAKIRKTG